MPVKKADKMPYEKWYLRPLKMIKNAVWLIFI
jgi:hypothetical protein